MSARFVAAVCLGVMFTLGCDGGAEPVVVPSDVAAKVKTDSGPQKNKAGKPNMAKLRND